MRHAISDHGMLSDCRANALVTRDGCIDWLCLPEPQDDPIFWSLLDEDRGGAWRVWLDGGRPVSRRYLPGTMTLETVFRCESGELRLSDALLLCVDGRDDHGMFPDHELVRRIECVQGRVEARMELAARPRFGRGHVRLQRQGVRGVCAHAGRYGFVIASDLPMRISDDERSLHAWAVLREGDTRWVCLGHTGLGPQVWPATGARAGARLRATEGWWRSWSGSCESPRIEPDRVVRSAMVLRSLIYPPTGAVVAAPTTSLPEMIGGERNWDYRYCWVRDASFTMRALLNLGMVDEARGFFSWLLYATRLTWPRLSVMYDVHGLQSPREREVRGVQGYAGSRPVRTGNAARGQLQLDTYGALLDAAWQFHGHDGSLSRTEGRMLRGFVRVARDSWREPDNGIWEIRAGRRHHTLSKAMCWIAMDRGRRLVEDGVLDMDHDGLVEQMDACRQEIETQGFNAKLNSYTATLDGDSLDASLLLLSVYGFEDPRSERMNATIDRIYERLGAGAALHRYLKTDDGLSGKEGSFGICGFWGVEALALAGRIGEARQRFEALLSHANELGLFAEEMDVREGRELGNFPQALTHVGVINAAMTLGRAEGGQDPSPPPGEGATP